jgi:hypothetical protein
MLSRRPDLAEPRDDLRDGQLILGVENDARFRVQLHDELLCSLVAMSVTGEHETRL